MVFGGHIVDIDGVTRREQSFDREHYLPPREALRLLLRNSSFVREPMVVVRRCGAARGRHVRTRGGQRGRHRHVGHSVLPARRPLPAGHHLRLHDPRGRRNHGDVEPAHDRGPRHHLRSRRRLWCRPRARGAALGGRLPPPVHPGRRLPPAARAAPGRGAGRPAAAAPARGRRSARRRGGCRSGSRSRPRRPSRSGGADGAAPRRSRVISRRQEGRHVRATCGCRRHRLCRSDHRRLSGLAGPQVVCADIDEAKVEALRRGEVDPRSRVSRSWSAPASPRGDCRSW